MGKTADGLTQLLAVLDVVTRQVRSLRKRTSALLQQAEKTEFTLATLKRRVRTAIAEQAAIGSRFILTDPRGTRGTREALRRAAVAGLRTIEMMPRPDGGTDVRIDLACVFTLPSSLAALLAVLKSQSDCGVDGFPAWLAYDDVLARLGKKTGKRARHALAEEVRRLRTHFEGAGLNRYLVDSCRRCGLRLLIRLAPSTAITPHTHVSE